ncbi:cysteine--tRNA ligase [Sphingomonas sp. 22R3R2A-7]|uniref:cysteine--tRNA ligase n=1 Tax=Sphingomonas sp. 22R3R2A-7 TaxID=3050230 RepID=UPI002FE0DECB
MTSPAQPSAQRPEKRAIERADETAMPLTLYNSLTRQLERFAPIDPANVGIYSCGPTVYNYAHIGNLRAYVFTDTLSRVLSWKGYSLTHIINITDVGHLTSDADLGDDKMEAAARATGQDIWAIARHYTEAFKRNLADLHIRTPTRFPLATDHIAEMIAFAEAIEARHCYRLADGLYFDTATVPDYGRLARSQDDAGESRIDPVEGKRHPQDFAIWRTSNAGENRQMEWDSPWGRGAPGWHLECSVMSKQYLGDRFDIHTGGIDHREIHHPNEIAQNQAHCGCADTGATLWMHNNFLVERSGKMSKSGGQFTTLQTLVYRGFHPLAYRLMCLQAQYRSELEFSWDNLVAATTRLKRLALTVQALRDRAAASTAAPADARVDARVDARLQDYRSRLDTAISDDLATPRALPILDELLADKRLSPADRLSALADFDAVLGLDLVTISPRGSARPAGSGDDRRARRQRSPCRTSRRAGGKDFPRSDAIRDSLIADGVEVMDGDPIEWDWRLA